MKELLLVGLVRSVSKIGLGRRDAREEGALVIVTDVAASLVALPSGKTIIPLTVQKAVPYVLPNEKS